MNLRQIFLEGSHEPYVEFDPRFIIQKYRPAEEPIAGYVVSVDRDLPAIRGYFVPSRLVVRNETLPSEYLANFSANDFRPEWLRESWDSPPVQGLRGVIRYSPWRKVPATLFLDHVVLERPLPDFRHRWENRWRFVPEYCLAKPPDNLLPAFRFAGEEVPPSQSVTTMTAIHTEPMQDTVVLPLNSNSPMSIVGDLVTSINSFFGSKPRSPSEATDVSSLPSTVLIEKKTQEMNRLRTLYEKEHWTSNRARRMPATMHEQLDKVEESPQNLMGAALLLHGPIQIAAETVSIALSFVLLHKIYRVITSH